MDLTISRGQLKQIRRAASASPDAEICGLLLGHGSVVEAIRPCANVAPDPRDSFEVDPVALIAAHRAARSGGPLLIGHYHSHPGGDATPSARDMAAAQPGLYWIILAANEAGCWLVAADGHFVPVVLAPI